MDMRALVGRNTLFYRQERGLTQEQLAARSGLTQHYISGLEKGARNPTVLTLVELANALGVWPEDLIANPRRKERRVKP